MPWRRISFATLTLAALATPWVGYGAYQALRIQVDDLATWIRPDYPVRVDYERFTRQFHNGDEVIASWTGCTIDDPRLEQFLQVLETDPRFQQPGSEPYFEQLISGNRVLQKLREPPLNLSDAESVDRLQGHLIGPDGTSTCAIITFSKSGVAERLKLVPLLREVLADSCGISLAEQRLAGPVIDGYEVAVASDISMRWFGLISTVIILLSCWWCLHSWRVAVLVFVTSLYCEAATLALVYYCGHQMTPIMIVMPPLILVVSVSGGIHLVNYHLDAVRTGELATVPGRAVATGWLPCVLSSGTTAIGLASLMLSEIQPIRDFGLYAAVGTLGTLAVLFLVIPGFFDSWLATSVASKTSLPRWLDRAEASNVPNQTLSATVRWLTQHRTPIAMACLAAMIAGTWFCQHIATSVRIETMFAAESRILQDYRWLEQSIGPLVPIEVLLRVPANSDLTQYDRARIVRNVQGALLELPEIGSTLSAASFLPNISENKSVSGVLGRSVANRKLERARQDLVAMKMLWERDQEQVWRITARVSALQHIDYGRFLDVVREHVHSAVVEDFNPDPSQELSIVATGVMPLVHAVQGELLQVLLASFLSAFLVITIVMMLVERGILAGLVAMLPNVFPMLIVFGVLGATRFPLDIGTVMTASVALGMAIDGTLHYLTFFRRSRALGESLEQAVESSYLHCTPAMTQSSIVCAAGLLMFAGSSFLPTHRFALMMVTLILAALFGDAVFLPALLAGPCGKLYRGIPL